MMSYEASVKVILLSKSRFALAFAFSSEHPVLGVVHFVSTSTEPCIT